MFRLTTTVCLCAVLSAAIAQADQTGEQDANSRPTYELTLSEFRMTSVDAPELSSEAILRAFHDRQNNDDVALIQTVRLTTLADLDCTVQFGKRAAVTTGVINNGRGGQQRVTETRSIGTMVRVIVTPHADKVEVRLSYEASRFDGEGDVDSPPDTLTTTYTTTLVTEEGKATLVGGQSTDRSTYLVIFVRS